MSINEEYEHASTSEIATRAMRLSISTSGVSIQERYNAIYPLKHRCP